MVIFPNAKINIGLSVIRKREDGFHDIESVFYPVGLCDALEYLPAGESLATNQDTISYSGRFPVTGKDICIKLVELLRESYSFPILRLHLHKNIPAGAGLGGGSSDAACLLKSLNNRFGFGLDQAQLGEYAGRIGSDCPFFINNMPRLVTGRGEKLQDIHLSLEGMFLVLVCPAINVSTADAYREVTPTHKSSSLQELVRESPDKWKDLIINQFEVPVFKKFPAIKKIKEKLYHMGAVYASMTGSGSAVYGLFRSEPEITGEFRDCFVHTEWQH
jgi:4-diphosphocytidyl-2-C-methyl-D-erythritol kinase